MTYVWKRLPAPKDGKQYLFYGKFWPYLQLKGGEGAWAIFCWSTFAANPSKEDYQWQSLNMGTPETWNVNWTHYKELDEPNE